MKPVTGLCFYPPPALPVNRAGAGPAEIQIFEIFLNPDRTVLSLFAGGVRGGITANIFYAGLEVRLKSRRHL